MTATLWHRRRTRAIELLPGAPHAEEMLIFYVGLVEVQEAMASRVERVAWASDARRAVAASGAVAMAELVSSARLDPLFLDFLAELREIGTEAIAAEAGRLIEGDQRERGGALETSWRRGTQGRFAARAFAEAVVTTLTTAGHGASEPTDTSHTDASTAASATDPAPATALVTSCLACGGPPQVGVLQDEPDARGRRRLHCALCTTEWGFPRLVCAHCESDDASEQHVHEAESLPHIRIEACSACEHYLKTIDLRKNGGADPIVDDLATPELDLWAREQGLTKVHPNLLGL